MNTEVRSPIVYVSGMRVIEAIRERCGDDFIIGIRITGDDFTKGGLNNTMMQEIAGKLDGLRILDYFSVIGATAETFIGEAAAVPDMTFRHATYAPLAASIKGVVSVPVITAGRVIHPMGSGADRLKRAGGSRHHDSCADRRSTSTS